MRILILTTPFFPLRGGVETVTDLLARGMLESGKKPVVLTPTLKAYFDDDTLPYKIIRTSSFFRIFKEVIKCDAVVAQGECLRLMLPLLFVKRKLLMILHMPARIRNKWIPRTLDAIFYKKAKVFSVSQFVQKTSIHKIAGTIENPYSDKDFSWNSNILGRTNNLLCIGISCAKGTFDLIDALEILEKQGYTPSLSIIGAGVDEVTLKERISKNKLNDRVRLLGKLSREQVAKIMLEHQILVVPSNSNEAFGIVTLEGLASGCKVICSNDGGLPEALGGNGMLFDKGDSEKLADSIKWQLDCLKNYSLEEEKNIKSHLDKYKYKSVASRYLNELDSIR